MKKKIFNIIKYITFFALGVLLFWYVYQGQNFSEIWNIIVNDVDFTWIIVMLIFGLLSHISRTLRWKIALEPLGEHPRTINAFFSVMISYFMNMILPRMGEFVRCGMLSKYEKISFTKLLGTVITERIIDMIMVMLLVFLAFALEFKKLMSFGSQNPEIAQNIRNITHSPLLWLVVFGVIAALIFYIYTEKKKGRQNKFEKLYNELIQGIKSILKIKRYKAYIAHTIFIWFMYFMMLYIAFFSFDFTKMLSPVAGLVSFVMTSASMIAPVQAGMGAWHFMAEKALQLYGVASVDGKIFALVVHSSMNLLILFCGAICTILIPVVNKNYSPKKQ